MYEVLFASKLYLLKSHPVYDVGVYNQFLLPPHTPCFITMSLSPNRLTMNLCLFNSMLLNLSNIFFDTTSSAALHRRSKVLLLFTSSKPQTMSCLSTFISLYSSSLLFKYLLWNDQDLFLLCCFLFVLLWKTPVTVLSRINFITKLLIIIREDFGHLISRLTLGSNMPSGITSTDKLFKFTDT